VSRTNTFFSFFVFAMLHKELGLRNVMNGNEKRVEVCENFIRGPLSVSR